ncbi:TlpA family protein disulfide reductase [Actinomadura kijaniata]|uniref:TlpA family protein disulfide reductase n=1 Tax=Actinomadura kijaniata TaxID=46161 RepID=UPI003F19FA06
MPVLVAAVVLVGALCLLDLLLTLGVIRRLREHTAALEGLLARGGGGRPPGDDLPAAGDAVAPFAATATDGTPVTAESLAGRVIVAFLSTECDACRGQLPRFVEQARGQGRDRVLGVVVGDAAAAEDMVAALEPVARVAVEPVGAAISAAFGVSAYPSYVVVEDGRVTGTAVSVTLLPDVVGA